MQVQESNLTIGRNLKIALFHLGSGMADVIATGVWNRIMISDLGFSATPIGLLVALRYFLAPLGVWAGKMSDRHATLGYRRLFWIWLGRAMMAGSVATLGWATADLVREATVSGVTGVMDAAHWVMIALSLILFSLGNALSGGTFLALVYDRSNESQRGRAVGIVWTFLLLGFTFGGILFGVMLPSHPEDAVAGVPAIAYSADSVLTLFLSAAVALALLWFVSLLGEEKRRKAGHRSIETEQGEASTSIRRDLKIAWSSPSMRAFFWFLGLSMLFAFSQDLILEPFGAEVFGMDARITTRFTAYWGSMAILGTIVFLLLGRRFKWLNNARMSFIGVAILVLTFGLFAFSALAGIRGLVTPGLITLGIGLGIWNVGTLGLMTEMSPAGRAGTFLGFWTLVVTIARGIGVSGAGIARDVMLQLTGDAATSYGLIFAFAGAGLVLSLVMLRRANTREFQETIRSADPTFAGLNPERVFAGAMD